MFVLAPNHCHVHVRVSGLGVQRGRRVPMSPVAPLLTREVVSLHGSLGSIAYSILNLIHCG